MYETVGKCYLGFSSGIDSQIIARCFIDMGIPFEPVFLHVPGSNDIELKHVEECERFFNMKVTRLTINLEDHREEWVARSKTELVPNMHQYQFEWLCKQLAEPWPFISQGAMEPYIVGSNNHNVCIYRNKFEDMRQRFAIIEPVRKVFDFPYSPEAIASYYTDNAVKGYCASLQSYRENALQSNGSPLRPGQYWNYYAKPIVKGQYFRKDIIWYGKLSGYETYPEWFKSEYYVKETRVTVPYWDMVSFLENSREGYRDYSKWLFADTETTIKPYSIKGPV
jgi:hypothetical protein